MYIIFVAERKKTKLRTKYACDGVHRENCDNVPTSKWKTEKRRTNIQFPSLIIIFLFPFYSVQHGDEGKTFLWLDFLSISYGTNQSEWDRFLRIRNISFFNWLYLILFFRFIFMRWEIGSISVRSYLNSIIKYPIASAIQSHQRR